MDSTSAAVITAAARSAASAVATAAASCAAPPVTPSEEPRAARDCVFHARGHCRRGPACPFSHAGAAGVVKARVAGRQRKRGRGGEDDDDGMCGVCYEDVAATGRRFGLLSGCEHVFCSECLVEWRKTAAGRKASGGMGMTCPACRGPSDFVVKSYEWVIGEEKGKVFEAFRERCRGIECGNYRLEGRCWFGKECFYLHKNQEIVSAEGSESPSAGGTSKERVKGRAEGWRLYFRRVLPEMDLRRGRVLHGRGDAADRQLAWSMRPPRQYRKWYATSSAAPRHD